MAYLRDSTIIPSSNDCKIKYNIENSIIEKRFLKTTRGRRSIEESEIERTIKLCISVVKGGRTLADVQYMGSDVM